MRPGSEREKRGHPGPLFGHGEHDADEHSDDCPAERVHAIPVERCADGVPDDRAPHEEVGLRDVGDERADHPDCHVLCGEPPVAHRQERTERVGDERVREEVRHQ